MDFSFAYHPKLIEIRRAVAPGARWLAPEKIWVANKAEFDSFVAAADAALLENNEAWSIEVHDINPERSIEIGSSHARVAKLEAIRMEREAQEAEAFAAQPKAVAFLVGEPNRRWSDETPNMQGCVVLDTAEAAIVAAQNIMQARPMRTRPLAIAAVSERPTLSKWQEEYSAPSSRLLRWIYIRREVCTRTGASRMAWDTSLVDFLTNGKPGIREKGI